MLQSARSWLPLAALLAAAPLFAQQPRELPPVHVPVHPADRRELDHVEALKAFALGAVAEKNNHLIKAVHAYEEAARLDPDAAAPLRRWPLSTSPSTAPTTPWPPARKFWNWTPTTSTPPRSTPVNSGR